MKPGDLVEYKDGGQIVYGADIELGLALVMEYSEEDDYIRVRWCLDDRAALEWLPAGDVDLVSPGEIK
jgi:hypothetical protein